MKNIKKHFNRFALSLLVLFAAGLTFTACSNLVRDFDSAETESAAQKGKARISLAVGLKSLDDNEIIEADSSRTVMATKADNEDNKSFTEIKLYGKKTSDEVELGSSGTLLKSWDTYLAMTQNPYDEELDAGTYDFMFTAKNYGATLTQTLSRKTLTSGKTTSLNFTSLTASEDGEQTGGIHLELIFNSAYIGNDNYMKFYQTSKPYITLSISLDSKVIATKDSETYYIAATKDSDGNTYSLSHSSASFISAPVSAGFHLVTFTFTAPDNSVLVYPVPVYVEAGYLSKNNYISPFYSVSTVKQDSEISNFKVTYNSNTSTEKTASQTIYPNSVLADAEALGFAGDNNTRFKEWNTKADGSGTAYAAGTVPDFTTATTLYAQWVQYKKVTYIINLKKNDYSNDMRLDYKEQKYEVGDSLLTAAVAFPDFTDLSKYTFCGWDTKADGSGIRYEAAASPDLTEDTILYAQWCGLKKTSVAYKDYYEVSDVSQWNALMGAPFANSLNGSIWVSVYLTVNYSADEAIDKPVASLTSDKVFTGKLFGNDRTITGLTGPLFKEIAEGASITMLKVKGPVCITNKGTIEDVIVSYANMTGYSAIAKENASTGVISDCDVSNCTIKGTKADSSDYGYAGVICNINKGEIKACSITSCTVDGASNSMIYTGGFCGKNEGTISGTVSVLSETVQGPTDRAAYGVGLCGYNAGSITATGSVSVTLEGTENDKASFGYVVGKNATNAVDGNSTNNPINTNITTNGKKTILNTGVITVDESRKYEITLDRTSLVSVTFTDTNKNPAQINGYFSSQNTTGTPSSYYFFAKDIDNSSSVITRYMEKGTYYLYLTENYFGKNTGCSAKVVID